MTDPVVQEPKGSAKEAAITEQPVVQAPKDVTQEAAVAGQPASPSQPNPDVRAISFEQTAEYQAPLEST